MSQAIVPSSAASSLFIGPSPPSTQILKSRLGEFDVTIKTLYEKAKTSLAKAEGKQILSACGLLGISKACLIYWQYLCKYQVVIGNSFTGNTKESRLKGMKTLTCLRKKFASNLFQKTIRVEVEALMHLHNDLRPFDEAVCIYGFNRLFTRDYASAGTDIDFMLVIASKNAELIDDIRQFIINIVRPNLQSNGIDIETSDYLMIGLAEYVGKLDTTKKALFTLANMGQKNTVLLTGAEKMLREKIFCLSDKQLALHFTTLLSNTGKWLPSDFQPALEKKLEGNGEAYRDQLINHLQKMACSELYVGNNPYTNKETIQTLMSKPDLHEKIADRTASFSIKYCINRIADLFASTTLEPKCPAYLASLENLGLVLSNIVCRLEADGKSPALNLSKGYSDISLEQIRRMSGDDRNIVVELLATLTPSLKAGDIDSSEKCYDALWRLADNLLEMAKWIEEQIHSEAYKFASS